MKKAIAGSLLAAMLASATIARADDADDADDDVRVHIKSQKHVQMEARLSPQDAWMLACDSPCDLDLPRAYEYRILHGTTADATHGETFHLSAPPGGSVTLTVDNGSGVQFAGGLVLAAGGTTLAMLGTIGLVAAGNASHDSPSSDPHAARPSDCSICGGDYTGLVTGISIVAIVAGAAAVATGVLLIADAGPSTSQKPVFAREPTWTSPRAPGPDKRAFVVPLSFTF